MRNSLGALLAIGLAGLQFVAVLAVVFSSYVTSERALLDHARGLLNDVGTNTIAHSQGFLRPARGAAELSARLAQNDVIASDSPQLLEQLLFQQLQLAPQFAGVYHGSEDGDFVYVMRSSGPGPFRSKIIRVDGDSRTTELIWRNDDFSVVERRMDPEDTYDPRTRPWYIGARESLTTIWTDPYIFYSSQQPGITLASPVEDGAGGVRGIVGVDIEISEISEFLSHLQIGHTGRALIIHANGDVIAHPNQSLLKTRDSDGSLRFANIRDIDDPIAQAAFVQLTGDGQVPVERNNLSQFQYGGEVYVSIVMPVMSDKLPWTIAAYAPEDDFTAVIKSNRRTNIWIAAVVAMITGIGGLALANYIYKPVRAFAVRSALISQGELDPSEPLPKTYQELENANTTLMQQIAARKETELEYGQTFALSSRGMAQVEAETGRFIRVNARFCEITGYDAGELERMTFSDLSLPGAPPFLTQWNGGSGKDDEINHEMRCLRKGGRTIWTSVNAIRVHNQEGKALHFVLTMDDISLNKEKEEKISQLNKDLSYLSRDNTMGQLASGLAHELNQPLTAIAQNADAALMTVEQHPQADAELREILEEIESQSLRAGEIIRALRAFIRKDEGVRTVFDIEELLDQTQRLVIAEAHDVGAKITTDMENLPPVEANRVQVAQVLVNLLRNAIEAVAETSDREKHVTVRAGRRGDQVIICVIDNGPGVDPSINLFTQFETTKPGGMGLGLTICRSIVQENGGRLWHEASETGGARFCFTLNAGGARGAG
ncbi:cache domain-containing protein [Tropicimonas marinistellae]|uniref:cache domain-containing protein n=1 Tax=Tropicimonas marinistellae TaxID=1739787 RepID=UPI00082B5DEC|nr:cache domain-containing protein [Tropicimonas marinistellae]